MRRLQTVITPPILMQRRYGNLTAIASDDSRPLRSVGMSPADAVDRTDALLTGLGSIPSVRIFRGVRSAGSRTTVAHAVSAGPLVILVESVAWPPGFYWVDGTGRVHCDGQYIGQATAALTEATRSCRARLPYTHRVSAVVVVHRTGAGRYTLPAANRELSWVLAEDAARDLSARLGRHPSTVSRHTVAALAAVADPEPDRIGA